MPNPRGIGLSNGWGVAAARRRIRFTIGDSLGTNVDIVGLKDTPAAQRQPNAGGIPGADWVEHTARAVEGRELGSLVDLDRVDAKGRHYDA